MRFSIILLKRELGDKTNRKAISWGWASCNRSESLARYSAKYWVISDREEIREWENACNECKNCKLKAGEQVMAPLLSVGFRQPLRAFAHVSVDFGGLIVTIQGRGSRHVQWQFLSVMRKSSRRGYPKTIVTDRGTNFVGVAIWGASGFGKRSGSIQNLGSKSGQWGHVDF